MPRVRDELNVSESDYKWMLEGGDGRCWICGHPELVPNRSLALDHDHETGTVRGLLCTRCNIIIGRISNPEWLRRAAEYLDASYRSFGDTCCSCGGTAPKKRIWTNGENSRYEYRCCRMLWVINHRTRGIPTAWSLGSVPFPDRSREPIVYDQPTWIGVNPIPEQWR